jgi:MFS family permease
MTETELLAVAAALMAVVGAARSTWSPCGLSMLSTITPLAERARGHRWGATASWFVAGSVVGGATLGLCVAGLAAGVGRLGLPGTTSAAVACGAALIAAASDAGVAGFRLPIHGRQVNERWLDRLRPWVYGSGFGWQIGTGVVTYIKTSGVYLIVVLCALTGRPWAALAVCSGFGLVRGLAVFLAHGINSPAALADFHRRFMARGPVALALVVAVEVLIGAISGWALAAWAGGLAVVTAAVITAVRLVPRRGDVAPTRSGGSRSARTA